MQTSACTTGWRPLAFDVAGARRELDERVYTAIERDLARVGTSLARDVAERVERFRESHDGLAHPYLYQLAYATRNTRGPGAIALADIGGAVIDEIEVSLERARSNAADYRMPIDDYWCPLAATTISARARSNLDEVTKRARTFTLNTLPTAAWKQLLSEAWSIIGDCYPDLQREMTHVTSAVVAFSCDDAISFSDIQAFGTVFLCDRFALSPLHVAEVIVHEASHSALNLLATQDALFYNDRSERYQTPLRVDPRPMMGLFHQMFVLSRMRFFHGALPTRFAGIDGDIDELERLLRQAIASVSKHAKLTPVGQTIFDDVRAAASWSH